MLIWIVCSRYYQSSKFMLSKSSAKMLLFLKSVIILFVEYRIKLKIITIYSFFQEMPLHISGWTYYVMSKHYLKQLNDPGYMYYSSELMVILTWLIAVVLVLPYRYYVRYIDFGVSTDLLYYDGQTGASN